MDKSLLKLLFNSIHDNWNLPAFSNIGGETYTYGKFAERIIMLQLVLEAAGLKPRDKVALIGKNSAGWAMNFFGIMSFGTVAVPILHDFKPGSIQHIINHCGAKALIVTDQIWESLDASQLEDLDIVLRVEDLQVIDAKSKKIRETSDFAMRLFTHKFHGELRFENLKFYNDKPDDLAMMSYTSGTSGFSKGVMIPHRALWSNVRFGLDCLTDLRPGADIVSILPMAHMYGLSYEICTEVCSGVHVHFLTRTPSPRIIGDALSSIRPCMVVAVPLIMEKIVQKKIFPLLQTPKMKLLTKVPLVKQQIYKTIRERLLTALGNNLYEVIVGGAAFSKDVERFLRDIHFPYTVGYGMTECAPLICYASWDTFKEGSVGRPVARMQVRIDSEDSENIVGEIQVKGDNVMLGYYNNKEATKQVFTEDGWLRTGDLGTMDREGNLTIRGRSKNMILGPSGQNIYPEEIEDLLNSSPYISESLVVEREGKLIALVHPDLELMDKEEISTQEISPILQQAISCFNVDLPSYCKLSSFQIFQDEFEKTPKHSIKRFLYK